MTANKLLRQIAADQHGYFTAQQALQAGYIKQLQSYHMKTGNWEKVDWAIFRLRGFTNTLESEFVRWSLWAAGKSKDRVVAVSHESALYYYGLIPLCPAAVHLAVTSVRKNSANPGCVLHPVRPEELEYISKTGYHIVTPECALRMMQPDLTHACQWAPVVRTALEKGLLPVESAHALLGNGFAWDAEGWRRSGGLPLAVSSERSGQPEGETMRAPGWRAGLNAAGRESWQVTSRSFTLVEMLVVVAIIAILAGLLLPSLQRAVQSSYQLSCQNNMRQTGFGWQNWIGDHSNTLPPAASGVSGGSPYFNRRGITTTVHDLVPSNASTNGVSWVALLQTYLSLGAFGNTSHPSTSYWSLALTDREGIFACPASTANILYIVEMQTGMNNWNIGGGCAWGGNAVNKLTDLYSPSRKVVFADTQNGGYSGSPGADNFFCGDTQNWLNFTRHPGLLNALMADCSIRNWTEGQYQLDVTGDWWKSEPWAFGRQRGSNW